MLSDSNVRGFAPLPIITVLVVMLIAGSMATCDDADAAVSLDGGDFDGEVGVACEFTIRGPAVNNPTAADSYTIGSTNIPDDLGLSVTTEYNPGVGIVDRFKIVISGTPQYLVSETGFGWDGKYSIELNHNGKLDRTYTGQITINGVSSISINGPTIIDFNSPNKSIILTATVDPVDVLKKELVWTVHSGQDVVKITDTSSTPTGGICTLEGVKIGNATIRATHSINNLIFAEYSVQVQEDVVIVEPIDDAIPVNAEYTRTPQTQPEDTVIEISKVLFEESEMDSSEYGDYIYVEGRTIHAILPEVGTWRIYYTASCPNYTPATGQINLEVHDEQITGTPGVQSIIASPNLQYDRMWDFVAMGVSNDAEIEWDFGDGSTESGSDRVMHTYDREGLMTVKVMVRNSLGDEATATVDIMVFGSDPSEDAWINVQYYWAYRVVGDIEQFSFDSEAAWLEAELVSVGDDRYIVVSGTPTMSDSKVGDAYDTRLEVDGKSLSWVISVYSQSIDSPVASFNIAADPDDPMTVIVNYTGSDTSYIQIDWGEGNGPQRYRGSIYEAITHTYPRQGTFIITITAHNGVGTDNASRSFTANYDEEHAPSVVIQPIGDRSVTVGSLVDFTITVDPEKASVGIAGASWLKADGNRVYGTPTQAGDFEFTIIASYGASSDRETFTIHVSDSSSGEDGGDDGNDGNESGTDWTLFAALAILMIIMAAAFWYFDAPYLIIISIVGIIASAWYTGVF